MAELTAETDFTIAGPLESYEEVVDLFLMPENAGVNAMRELRYPDNVLPPLVYEDMPDKWENFDSEPLTARPQLKGEMTLTDTKLAQWSGYQKDRPIREIWPGDDSRSLMSAYFFRRLCEYFFNPPSPAQGYITWWPKDRTTKGYKIVIENLQAGGESVATFHNALLRAGRIMGEIVFTFRIVGEAD
jgi:hypothetical protein